MSVYDIRKVQMIELEILKEFDRVCKKNNLSYFLDSGTALGAARHGGFIPWDDDIDVGMLRDDYEKFINEAYKDLDSKYFLQTTNTDPGCPCLFAKIRKEGTTFLENNKKGMKMHMGIWIDILPFDYMPADQKKQKEIIRKVSRTENIFLIKKIPHKFKNYGQNGGKYYIVAFIRKILHYILQIIPDKAFISRINRIINKNNKNGTEYLSCLFYGKPIIWETKKMIPFKPLTFEGIEFSGVCDNDYYLRIQYNDYMQLPPEDKRTGHRPLFIDYGE